MLSVDANRCAVLVVDMQNDFCHPDGHYGRDGMDVSPFMAVVDPVSRLVSRARSAGATIAFTRLVYDSVNGAIEDRHVIKPRNWIPKGRRLQPGSWGSAILDTLAPASSDIIIDKPAYSAFEATSLDDILRQRAISTIILCGVVTYACVLATAFSAFDKGYDVVLASDAAGSWSNELGDAASRIVDLLMGQSMPGDDIALIGEGRRTAQG